jgi:5-methylthioadenosine/S-adenosylhomocysteine deaminase
VQTIIWAGKVILDARLPAQNNFGVVVDGNHILAMGDRQELFAQYPQAERFGNETYLMIPGMINSHDHGRVLGTAPVGIPDDMLEIWITRIRTQPGIDPYTAAAYSGLCLLKSGVSATVHLHTVRDWKGVEAEAAAVIRGYRDAGIRVVFCIQMNDQNPLVYENLPSFLASLPSDLRESVQPLAVPAPIDRDAYFALYQGLYDLYHDEQEHTIHLGLCPSGGQWCSDGLVLAMVQAAQKNGSRVHMHLLETKFQQMYAHRRWGKSFVQHLEEIGALGPWLTLAHMIWPELKDFSILSDRGVGVVHNPSSNLRLRSGIAPVDRIYAAGISLGVGLDGFALDNDQDYLRELRLAWFLGNKPGATAYQISAGDILNAGTSGGAAVSFGEDIRVGRLDTGYLADLILLDWEAVQGVWFSPGIEPVDVLLQQGSRRHIRHVMVNGRWAVKDGCSVLLDELELLGAIRQQIEAHLKEHGQVVSAVQQLGPFIRKFYQEWENP